MMCPAQFGPVRLSAELRECVDQFLAQSGPQATAHRLSLATVKLLKRLVGQASWSTAHELLGLLRGLGQALDQRLPTQVTVSNVFRRALKAVREEYGASLRGRSTEGADPPESLHKMVSAAHEIRDFHENVPELKTRVLENLDELFMELETASEEIASQALEHIHTNEIIMTLGRSRTVERFLKTAALERGFHVIVVEAAPEYTGQAMAASLAQAQIATTVITDTAVFAMMSRVNKVIIGTHVMLAHGGLKAATGSYTLALAARHFAVPLYVCATIGKLTPVFCTPHHLDDINQFVSPQATLGHLDGPILARLQTVAPRYEYVPPDLVTLCISNVSGYAPSYVYRLLSELYHPEDHDLAA